MGSFLHKQLEGVKLERWLRDPRGFPSRSEWSHCQELSQGDSPEGWPLKEEAAVSVRQQGSGKCVCWS